MRIDALTPEQEAMIPAWRDKWIAKGLSTSPVDFEAVEAAAMAAYALIGANRPIAMLRVASPYAATIAGAQAWLALKGIDIVVSDQVGAQVWDHVGALVRDKVWDHVGDKVSDQVRAQVSDQVRAQAKEGFFNYGSNGPLWASYCSRVTFFRDVCGWQDPILEKFAIAERLTEAGWTWWNSSVFVASDRPLFIHRDADGQLHSETGHAIEYRDGWGFSCWHGVRIPDEWLTGALTPDRALTWKKVEQRRAACEILGWAMILESLAATTIDVDADPEIGELLEAEIPGSGKERFLRVRCGTGRTFVLPVPRDMKTALEANSWTYGIATYEYKPEVRT